MDHSRSLVRCSCVFSARNSHQVFSRVLPYISCPSPVLTPYTKRVFSVPFNPTPADAPIFVGVAGFFIFCWKAGKPWLPSFFCKGCIEVLIKRQWPIYEETLAKATCKVRQLPILPSLSAYSCKSCSLQLATSRRSAPNGGRRYVSNTAHETPSWTVRQSLLRELWRQRLRPQQQKPPQTIPIHEKTPSQRQYPPPRHRQPRWARFRAWGSVCFDQDMSFLAACPLIVLRRRSKSVCSAKVLLPMYT